MSLPETVCALGWCDDPTTSTPNARNPIPTETERPLDSQFGARTSTNDGGGAEKTPAAGTTHTVEPESSVMPTVAASSSPNPEATAIQTGIPVATSSSGGGSDGVSKGAVAGIAIATAIIGAAIAFAAAFFLFKRRKRSSVHRYNESNAELTSPLKGEHISYTQVAQSPALPVIAASTIPSGRRDLNIADLSNSSDFLAGALAPAADEQTVKHKASALFNQIQHHVDNYYRDVHATMTPSMESDLGRFGSSTANLLELLQESSMSTVAIKHALVGYILSIVSPEEEDQATLFPTEISGLKENERSTDTPGDQAVYILYKRLAVHLHSPNPAALQSRQSDIREAAEHFALTFFPWANPAYNDQEKDENLVDTINNALDLSIWLFGQPYIYEFAWEGVGRRGTVVAPGLTRLTDSRGKSCDRPQIVLDPVVVAA